MITSRDERRFFSRLIRLSFLCVSLATAISLCGRVHWFAELFTHFRFYFLLAQAVLALIFLHSRRRALLLATLALAVPNAWYVVPYLTPLALGTTASAGDRADVEIVAVNLNYRNDDHNAMRAYLESVSPDVIVAAEMTGAWREALRHLDVEYPHQIGRWRSDSWGLWVYSRLPFVAAELLDLGVPDSVQGRVVIGTDAQELEIFAVHLQSPTNPERAAKRNTQLAELARLAVLSARPTIIVGDLNITPFSPHFGRFLERARVVDARKPAGFHFTWPAHPLPVWIPIDHALADRSVNVTRVRRGRDAGSDHYPLEVSIDCCAPGAG
jgi:endonuclease/exonuclease/phosphatase (EEP) superfamily protein YafD